jgi:hypothetical protein
MLRTFFNWVNSDQVEKYLSAPRILPEGITDKSEDVYFSSEFADPKYPWKRYYMMISACPDGWLATKYISDHSKPDQPAEIHDSGAAGHPNQVVAALAGFDRESRRVHMTEIKQSKPNYNEFASKFGYFVTPEGQVIEIKKDRPITHEAKIDQKSQKNLFTRTDGAINDWYDLYRFFDRKLEKHMADDPGCMESFASRGDIHLISNETTVACRDLTGAFDSVSRYLESGFIRHNRDGILLQAIDWHFADRLPPFARDIYVASGLVAYLRAGGQAFQACVASGMGSKEVGVMNALKDESEKIARDLGMSSDQSKQVVDLFVRGHDHMAPHFPIEILIKKIVDLRAELEIKWAEERRIAEEKRQKELSELRKAAEAFMAPVNNQKCLPAPEPAILIDANMPLFGRSRVNVSGKNPTATLIVKNKMSSVFNSAKGFRLAVHAEEGVEQTVHLYDDNEVYIHNLGFAVRAKSDSLEIYLSKDAPPRCIGTYEKINTKNALGILQDDQMHTPEKPKSGLRKIFGI